MFLSRPINSFFLSFILYALFFKAIFFPLHVTVPVIDFYASHENYFKYIKYTWYSNNYFLIQTYKNNLQ